MKNKIIVAILLIMFCCKAGTAQVTQSTVKPVNNKVSINNYQYSVTLTPDSTNPAIRKFVSLVDSSLNINCSLVITGMPNDTVRVILQLFERTSRSSAFPNWPSQITQPVMVVLSNEGYAVFNLNKGNAAYSNSNREEKILCSQLVNAIQTRVWHNYFGGSLYKFGTVVIFSNKNLRDKTLESSIIF